MSSLSCMYYPFSRSVNVAALKQKLLVFEQINFLDPVDSTEWREKLFTDMARGGLPSLGKFQEVKASLPALVDAKIANRIDPHDVKDVINDDLTINGAISDLLDATWVQKASLPQRHKLPCFRDDSGRPLWQIFRPKLPDQFINALLDTNELKDHLVETADDWTAWTLSYAAGSAISMNVHLAVADSLAGC